MFPELLGLDMKMSDSAASCSRTFCTGENRIGSRTGVRIDRCRGVECSELGPAPTAGVVGAVDGDAAWCCCARKVGVYLGLEFLRAIGREDWGAAAGRAAWMAAGGPREDCTLLWPGGEAEFAWARDDICVARSRESVSYTDWPAGRECGPAEMGVDRFVAAAAESCGLALDACCLPPCSVELVDVGDTA